MKRIAILLSFILVGCSTVKHEIKWFADQRTDSFTDESTCKATVASIYANSGMYTKSGHLYPYVQEVNGVLRVGVMSGGKYPIPVGDVQLRIDNNKAWTLMANDSPIDKELPLADMSGFYESLPDDQQAMVKGAIKSARDISNHAFQTFTVATGDKAKRILAEMLNGKKLIYRSIGMIDNGNIGEYPLGASLKLAIDECNIDIKG